MEENNTRYLAKFRAWDRITGEVHYWTAFDDYPLREKNATAPQCNTGFIDKNGNEIFTGDIVEYENNNYLVSNKNGSFIFKPLFKTDIAFIWFPDIVDFQHKMSIIGNTFTDSKYLAHHLCSQNTP